MCQVLPHNICACAHLLFFTPLRGCGAGINVTSAWKPGTRGQQGGHWLSHSPGHLREMVNLPSQPSHSRAAASASRGNRPHSLLLTPPAPRQKGRVMFQEQGRCKLVYDLISDVDKVCPVASQIILNGY